MYASKNHCNGFLLLSVHLVLNPATRLWVRLPPPLLWCTVTGMEGFYNVVCLAFDPTVSPDFEVFMNPRVPCNLDSTETIFTAESEWPPSSCAIRGQISCFDPFVKQNRDLTPV